MLDTTNSCYMMDMTPLYLNLSVFRYNGECNTLTKRMQSLRC